MSSKGESHSMVRKWPDGASADQIQRQQPVPGISRVAWKAPLPTARMAVTPCRPHAVAKSRNCLRHPLPLPSEGHAEGLERHAAAAGPDSARRPPSRRPRAGRAPPGSCNRRPWRRTSPGSRRDSLPRPLVEHHHERVVVVGHHLQPGPPAVRPLDGLVAVERVVQIAHRPRASRDDLVDLPQPFGQTPRVFGREVICRPASLHEVHPRRDAAVLVPERRSRGRRAARRCR